MNVADLLSETPFASRLGIEVIEAADGHARGRLELAEHHSTNPHQPIAHGGVAYALADTVGGAAVIAEVMAVCPTIDMRIDYLAPARTDLVATGEVRKLGETRAVADVSVESVDGTSVAVARGAYKIGGDGADSPWTAGRSLPDGDDLTEPEGSENQ